MKRALLALMILALSIPTWAQEVADVSIKSRFQRDQGVYAGVTGAFVLGKTLGDYGAGTGFELGYMRRLNKLISIGAGVSTLQFKYNAAKTYKYYYDQDSDEQVQLTLSGGDISMANLGINLKLNFIPVSDASKFSFYGIVTPFISHYTRKDVSGQGDFYASSVPNSHVYDSYDFSAPWSGYPDASTGDPGYPALRKVSKLTGGANVGFGVEWLPARVVSYFLQATVGYTGAISYVSTGSYLHPADVVYDEGSPPKKMYADNGTDQKSYFNPNFPMVKKAFGTASVKFGVAFNF